MSLQEVATSMGDINFYAQYGYCVAVDEPSWDVGQSKRSLLVYDAQWGASLVEVKF